MTKIQEDDGAFSTISAFLRCWDTECAATVQVFEAIPNDLLHLRIIPEYRSLASLAWHITQSPAEMLERTKLHVFGPPYDSTPPKDLKTIIQTFEKVAASAKEAVSKNWKDKDLLVVDEMYGQQWTRSKTLTCLLHHMIHHRAQMTVLLRIGSAKVPGVYGPAKEEWVAYGMTPPKL